MNESEVNRRGFLVAVVRWLSVALVAAMAVVLGRRSLERSQDPGAASQDCIGQSICSRCDVSRTCNLPQAISRWQALGQMTNGE